MKKGIHPNYRKVLFVDTATGSKFLIGSTLQTEETEEFEGQTYPVLRVPVSAASHPFFVGSDKMVDTEGRVSRFKNKYKNRGK